jgi:hypothetical protein
MVVIFKLTYNIGRVFVVEISVAILFVELRRGDIVGDRVHDVLMERRKHKGNPLLSLKLVELLPRHFR